MVVCAPPTLQVRICDFGVSESAYRQKQAAWTANSMRGSMRRLSMRSYASSDLPMTANRSSTRSARTESSILSRAAAKISSNAGLNDINPDVPEHDNTDSASEFSEQAPSFVPAQGTVEYMAPEIFACYVSHANCRGRMREPMDVYSFGVLLWELLQSPADGRSSRASTSTFNELASPVRSRSNPAINSYATKHAHSTRAATIINIQTAHSEFHSRLYHTNSEASVGDATNDDVTQDGEALILSDLRQVHWPRQNRDDVSEPPPPMPFEELQVRSCTLLLAVTRAVALST